MLILVGLPVILHWQSIVLWVWSSFWTFLLCEAFQHWATDSYFVNELPRPYDLVLFFTAESCRLCEAISSELNLCSQFYYEANAIYPAKDGDKILRSVFFIRIKYRSDSAKIFKNFGFKNVPNLVVSQPRSLLIIDESERQAYMRDFMWQISPTDGKIIANKILEFINKRTDRSVEYKESLSKLFTVLVTLFSAIAAVYIILTRARAIVLDERLWFVAGLMVYVICISGVVYNIIHGTPFMAQGRDGSMEWIQTGVIYSLEPSFKRKSTICESIGKIPSRCWRLHHVLFKYHRDSLSVCWWLCWFLGIVTLAGLLFIFLFYARKVENG